MRIKIFSTLILLFAIHCSFAQSQDLDKTITVDGRERQYAIHLPPSFNTSKNFPVIFAFHGGGGEYKKVIRYYNLNGLADENGYIVVYPNAINKAWSMSGVSSRIKKIDNSVDDVKFISELLDNLIANYKADSKHVFCTGISCGGIFSLFLAWQLSDRITAIAPVCASIPQAIAEEYSFKHPTPVLLINGTEDPLINYNGGPGKMNGRNAESQTANMLPTEELVSKIAKLNNCQSNPVVKDFPDADPKDGCTATDYSYSCSDVQVEFIKVVNGGHTWPGGIQYLPKVIIGKVCKDFNAEEKVFEFFKKIR
ncbi:MAG TPA: PHB depolymerase family esterase [Puia sp.]|nr:PHB depolymerase family esterase [Puia sp.]